jgi:DUF438 domain-containing protein
MPSLAIGPMLISEHRQVAKLLDTISKTTPRAAQKRRQLFQEVDEMLTLHSTFEESNVYPLLEDRKNTRPLVLEAIEEHLQVKRLLHELRTMEPSDERWMAKLTVLTENIRHHVKEEESEAIPALKKTLSQADQIRLADEYTRHKTDPPRSDDAAVPADGELVPVES